jgi:hypothetical protein
MLATQQLMDDGPKNNVPGMTDADDMVNITQGELQKLVGQYTSGIGKSEQGVVGEDGPQSHGSGVQNGLETQVAQAGMAMDNFNLLPDDDVSKDWKEGEDGGEGGLAVYDEEGYVVDLEAIGQISNAGSTFVCMGDDDDFVAAIDEFGGELVYMRLDSA